jgi:hypothetical protein
MLTVMALSIIRLFSGGRRFTRYWDQLETELHDACVAALAKDSSIDQGRLFLHLRKRFTLHPVSLGFLDEVTVKSATSSYTLNGVAATGHRATARVSFSGSKVLLQNPPEPEYRFPFLGQVTRHALNLHRYLPDLDARVFAADVQVELDRIKPLLVAYERTIHDYDEQLRKRVEAKIASF